MLVAAADICGDNLENDSVLALAIPQRELGIVNRTNFNFSSPYVCNSAVTRHVNSSP
jgi:hypothetical protein